MIYRMEFAGFSVKGPFRQKNEDNLFIAGDILQIPHEDSGILSGQFAASDGAWAAVFDGVGGEAKGESASFLAARVLADAERGLTDPAEVVSAMNRAVCSFAKKEHIRGMGTTVAAVRFTENGITGFNVGDSRCYHVSGSRMEILSVDHARYAGAPQQRMLTQYVGIDESDFVIMPEVFRREYADGDVYMLCTDGITDVIIDRRIKDILTADNSLQEKLEEIRKRLECRGTPDNATVLLVRVREKNQ